MNGGNETYELESDYIVVHHHYKLQNEAADLALVRLEGSVTFDSYIQPVCLVDGQQDPVAFMWDKDCYTIGYGATDGKGPARLQKLRIAATSRDVCRQRGLWHEAQLCIVAKETDKESPCLVSTHSILCSDTGDNCIHLTEDRIHSLLNRPIRVDRMFATNQ